MAYYYRSYHYPDISIKEIDECCLAFHLAVNQGLKSSGVDAHVYTPFRLHVWRYLSRDRGRGIGRGSYLLEKEDFNRFLNLPRHWYYILNQHGEGTTVDFPIKVRPLLGKSGVKNFIVDANGSLTKAPITYTEKLSIYFVKKACNIHNV